ncbi:helix-turn-helix domain-containing protein [Zoogloea sp.]|uniref:helix-turn-helix domain-containing protein n=1 Tax=Zoogloea sp. TaxID=49181 RepID=UPI0035B3B212
MDISKVLDDAKEALNVDSDYKLAKRLEISNGYIAQWRKGTRIPDAYACARLAEILRVDPFELLAQVEAATEKNEARRTYWKQVTARIAAGTAAGFFLVAVSGEAEEKGLCDVQGPVIFRS